MGSTSILIRFSRLGIKEDMSDLERKQVILSNQLSLLTIFLTFFYGLSQQYLFDSVIKAYLSYISIPLFFLVPVFNHFKSTKISRVFFSSYMPLPIFSASIIPKILHKDGSISFIEFVDIRFFLLGFMVIPLLLFDFRSEKKYLFPSLGLYLLLLILYDLTHNFLGIGIDTFVIDKDNYLVLQLSPIICAVLLIGSFLFLKDINNRFEAKVRAVNFNLVKKQEEILTQNEELRQQQEEIMAQREFIQEKNKELTLKTIQVDKSINSAVTIQKSILPSTNRLREHLKNYFIIYRPKDVVSGDFYWIKEIGDTTLLATVDCTGHGVPGAFMSLIGKNLLDLIIETHKGKIDPAFVLQRLHHDLREALHASNEKVYGMDLSFVKIVKGSNYNSKITFAGAKSSMYFVDDNKKELVEVKGDRRSIGGIYQEDFLFNNQEYTLSENSIFYLTSDGYQDQNNPERQRLGKKHLKNILLKASLKPIEEQKCFLEGILETHMQDTEQRDDIMLIGIQV